MATSFDRWEKDPFFAAAEEVQDAADRMESVYRQWIQVRKDSAKSAGGDGFIDGEMRRELHLALGTAKWQLEEFERAVKVSDETSSAGDERKARHSQFFVAIGNRIWGVENSLRASSTEAGNTHLAWVRLDEGERDELARFLSCPVLEGQKVPISSAGDLSFTGNNLVELKGESFVDYSKNSCQSNESSSREIEEKKMHTPRRAASAAGDIETWTVTITSEGEDTSERSSDDRPSLPAARVLSFSALAGTIESSSGIRWYRNGFRKWRGRYQQDVTESHPLRNNHFTPEIDACYERSKSCLSSCDDETYDKQLHGSLGALQRLIQRSQYHIQYGHPIQIVFWGSLAFLMIVLLILRAS